MMINRYTTRRKYGSENYYTQQRRSRLKLHQNGEWVKYEDVEHLLKRTQKVEDYIESRLDELQERFRKSHAATDKVYYSIAIRELRHIKKELE